MVGVSFLESLESVAATLYTCFAEEPHVLETTDKELYLDFVDMAGTLIPPSSPLLLHQLTRQFTQLTCLIAPTRPNSECWRCCGGPCLAWYLSQLGSEEESEAGGSLRTMSRP